MLLLKRTIEDLWNGNIAPCERCGAHDPEISDLLALMWRNKQKLNSTMSAQQQEDFEKYTDCSDEYVLRITEHAFCEGFCLACKLLTESLSGNSTF